MKKKMLVSLISSLLLSSNCTWASSPANQTSQFWWPNVLDLSPLRDHLPESSPLGKEFNYAEQYETIDMVALKKDIKNLLSDSQDWWPADYGNYGPLFIRLAWHAAGTYRNIDGRGGSQGGQQRFTPLNSWPDNANLDKARRLLWPLKQKYGAKISWGDLITLTANLAMEDMGFETLGFAGGRRDDWESDNVYWGPEKKFLTSERYKNGELDRPFGAAEMGLIYVNPVGPNNVPDPQLAADDIRSAFSRMSMNDEETVALIAGGHSFGKAHGAGKAQDCLGPEPAVADIEEQGLGWKNKCGTGNGADTITSGLEGAWTVDPISWSSNYLDNLMNYHWVKTKSPAGAVQWIPDETSASSLVVDAHRTGIRHAPIMFTTDIALKVDPEYRKIVEKFREDLDLFNDSFAKAWFKLTHRDMGPKALYLGNDIPSEDFLWQDPLPKPVLPLVSSDDVDWLKKQILNSEIPLGSYIKTAWASASTYRNTDMRGGANGARLMMKPQIDWSVNDPKELKAVLRVLRNIKGNFSDYSDRTVSMADLIVLAGYTAIEASGKNAGFNIDIKFLPGRTDVSQDMIDIDSFSLLKPQADAFRNYYQVDSQISPVNMMIDKADTLGLTVPEMTVLIGGLRSLGVNVNDSKVGVFTQDEEELTNDFFINLLDMSTKWVRVENKENLYEGIEKGSGLVKWTASSVDLIFGSNSELRSISEYYASEDGRVAFAQDFAKAWTKVMRNDRFDLNPNEQKSEKVY